MVLQERLYTVDEFLEFINRPEFEGKQIELHEGVVVEVPPSSKKNTILEMWIGALLAQVVVPKALGSLTGPDAGYKIDGHNYLQPEVAFISKERAGGLEGVEFPVAPDLAVEVISPNESGHMVTSKARMYLQAGTTVVWAVYPIEKAIHEYRLGENGSLSIKLFGVDDTLVAADVLPEFRVRVGEIFKVIE